MIQESEIDIYLRENQQEPAVSPPSMSSPTIAKPMVDYSDHESSDNNNNNINAHSEPEDNAVALEAFTSESKTLEADDEEVVVAEEEAETLTQEPNTVEERSTARSKIGMRMMILNL